LINALVTSAIVWEEEKDDGASTTKASILFTSYFDSVPYAAANGQGKILAVSSSTSGRQEEHRQETGLDLGGQRQQCIKQAFMKKISATQQSR
jgi:hypothetical protein